MPVEETPEQREAKAVQLAEARGRRQQEVDGRLDEHDRRLKAINGSIERSARAQEELGSKVAGVERRVDEVLAKMETAERVSTALARAAQDAVTKQLSRREFWLGVAAVVAVFGAAFLQGGHL
jgi:sugar-specific transcriptional regulator TrmB